MLNHCHDLSLSQNNEPENTQTRGVYVGPLVVLEDDDNVLACKAPVANMTMVIVLQDIPDLSAWQTYIIYALIISYPKTCRNTFDTIQHVFMGLGSG